MRRGDYDDYKNGILKVISIRGGDHTLYAYMFSSKKKMYKYITDIQYNIKLGRIQKSLIKERRLGALTYSYVLEDDSMFSYIFFYKGQYNTRLIAHECSHVADNFCNHFYKKVGRRKVTGEDKATCTGEFTWRIIKKFNKFNISPNY